LNITGLSANMDFKNLAKAGVVAGVCQPPAKAGGNSTLLIGQTNGKVNHQLKLVAIQPC
jgi:hypothetical protein